jgi:dipeptidyl-peptidase-4
MKKNNFLIPLLLLFSSISAAQQNVVFMQDDNYTMLSEDGNCIVKYNSANGNVMDTLFCISQMGDTALVKIDSYTLSENERYLMFAVNSEQRFDGSIYSDYYVFFLHENRVVPLSEYGKQQSATFAPNGRIVAFVRGNNLYLKRLDYGTEIAITKDDSTKVFNGTPDLSYRKAFAADKLFAWSPDSKQLAFIRLDASNVRDFCFDLYPNAEDDFLATPIERQCFKYPTAGTQNPVASVQVYDVFYKSTKKMNILNSEEILIPRIIWGENPDEFGIITLNRSQNQINFVFANPRSTICKSVIKEDDPKGLNLMNIQNIALLPENQIVFASERNGYNHLYLYSPVGILKQQITNGDFDVIKYYAYDIAKKLFYYQSTEISPAERHIYNVSISGKKSLLNKEAGTHDAFFSPNMNYFVHNISSADKPDVFSISKVSGNITAVLKDSKTEEDDTVLKKEFFSLKTSDGTELNAWKILPPDFNKNKKYPVIMFMPDNLDSRTTQNKWQNGQEQLFAENEYIVVCVDSRDTAGKGRDFRQSTYMQAGLQEAQDQIEAAKYLTSLSYVDKNRIGIYGWGVGGHTALLAMSAKNGIFKSGIVVAPVTDWHLYNSIYTENRMKRPQENQFHYKETSAIELADKLKGKLLLIHGTSDADVHLQNSIIYAKQLTKHKKPFEMQLYTNGDHFLSNPSDKEHLEMRILDFVLRELKN